MTLVRIQFVNVEWRYVNQGSAVCNCKAIRLPQDSYEFTMHCDYHRQLLGYLREPQLGKDS